MSVSKETSSPGRMMRSLDSWNQGLVRAPEVSRRVSIHSPPMAVLTWLRIDQSWFSVMPGSSASRMRAMAVSHTAIEAAMQASSSADLIERASSMTSWPLRTSMPRSASAAAPSGSQWSSARRRLPPPWAATRSATSAAQARARSSNRGPAPK